MFAMTSSLVAADEMDRVKEGYSLTSTEVERLESGLQKKPDNEDARLKLLGYYAGVPKSIPLDLIRSRRTDHILWLIQTNPKSGLFNYATAVWKIFRRGDELADPAAFDRAKALWQTQIKMHARDDQIKVNAASFIELGDPEAAASLLNDLKMTRALGSLYAYVLLGIISQDYKTGDARAVDDSIRASNYANQIMTQLRSSNDPLLVGGAGFWLAVQGGMLYSDGTISWDYTVLANELLVKARRLDPNTLDWYAVSTTLPVRGERPARVLRVGGQSLKLRKQIAPQYPAAAKAKGIEGIVNLSVVIGLDGKIAKAVVETGPGELIAATLDAISQWEYEPVLLNGRPVFVITKISINYR